jgi:uncharacterized membrane protein YfcA
MSWDLSVAGLLIGFLVGLTGMGGGSLMTPILVIVFGFEPTLAIGTDIAHGAIFKTIGGLRHRRLGNVQARLSGWMFLGSAPASLAGVWLADWLQHRYGDGIQSVSARVLGSALIFGAIGLVAKTLARAKPVGDGPFLMTRRDRIAAVAIGVVGGFVVGLTSVGTGVFFGLTMLIVFPLRAVKVVGTDVFHAAALLYVAGIGHWLAGNVDLHVVLWLLLGSIPGVLLGSQLTLSVDDRPLRVMLAAVLLLSGIKLLDLPGTTVVIAAGLAAGLGAVMVWLGRSWAARVRIREPRVPPPGDVIVPEGERLKPTPNPAE